MTEKDKNIVVAERERFEQYMFKKFGFTGNLKDKVERFELFKNMSVNLLEKKKCLRGFF